MYRRVGTILYLSPVELVNMRPVPLFWPPLATEFSVTLLKPGGGPAPVGLLLPKPGGVFGPLPPHAAPADEEGVLGPFWPKINPLADRDPLLCLAFACGTFCFVSLAFDIGFAATFDLRLSTFGLSTHFGAAVADHAPKPTPLLLAVADKLGKLSSDLSLILGGAATALVGLGDAAGALTRATFGPLF